MQESEITLLKLRSAFFLQEGKYKECFQIAKLLIDSKAADIFVHEVFAKSAIQCGWHNEYAEYFRGLEELSKNHPNLQIPFFDYLAHNQQYHEMFVYVWECLTRTPNVEVMSYFDKALLTISKQSKDFKKALNDLSNQQDVDPLTRIMLSFSSLSVDEVLPLRAVKYKNKGSLLKSTSSIRDEGPASQTARSAAPTITDDMCSEEKVLRALKPLEEMTRSWRGKRAPDRLIQPNDLAGHLSVATGPKQVLIISISHDDYRTIPGGVQVCIQREQAHAAQRGLRYLQVYPYDRIMRLADLNEDPDTIIALNLDGVTIGACRMSTLISWVKRAAADTGSISVIVHHLLGHAPELVAELVRATGSKRCVFWLHDFFTMCPSFSLMRNNLVFCGGPAVDSNACMLCLYGRERETHVLRMRTFFETLEIAVASPSAVTAEFWLEKAGLPHASFSILPHMTVETVQRAQPLAPQSGPVTIGFLGPPAQHKGWAVYFGLMQEFAKDNRYRFAVLSAKRPEAGEDSWQPVHVTAQTPNAMSDAIAAERIDIVLHWPSWQETFSFTTFEAFVGGAHVVTHRGSGNVARAVRETGRGVILETEDQLRDFFRDEGATALAERRRALHQSVEVIQSHSDMSFPLIVKG